jgi:hypothetical protein
MTTSPAFIASKSVGSMHFDAWREIVGVQMVQFEPGHETMLCFAVRQDDDSGDVVHVPVESMRMYRFNKEPKEPGS